MNNSQSLFIPELLCPAGSLEKLKVAINYGADAVYVAGQKFGLRMAADNFTLDELKEGAKYVHERQKKIYVVLNGFLFDDDLVELQDFVTFLEEIKIDAVIVSDIGVIQLVRQLSQLEVHLSTQASCLSVDSALFYKTLGVTRIVLGREISLTEAEKIKKESGLEIEMFIHGSMCMAYSGNCTISNFTQGRDSNRGGCAHSCRFEYTLDFGHSQKTDYFMSSKDLRGLELLAIFSQAKIDSLKIEGRMKSPLYAALTAKVYREALDLMSVGNLTIEKINRLNDELEKVSHRTYTTASLLDSAGAESTYDERENDDSKNYHLVGQIESCGSFDNRESNDQILILVRSTFSPGDILEILTFGGPNILIKVIDCFDLKQRQISKTNPSTLVWISFEILNNSSIKILKPTIEAGMMLRNVLPHDYSLELCHQELSDSFIYDERSGEQV